MKSENPIKFSIFTIILFTFTIFSKIEANKNSRGSSHSTYLGEECSDNSTCSGSFGNIDHSYCTVSAWEGARTGFCQCMEGYVASQDLRRCLQSNTLVGGQCEETVQCMGHSEGKSLCLPGSGICECKSGYIHNRDMTECLVKINTLGTRQCTEDVQCQLGRPGRLSHCAQKIQGPVFNGERVCRCKPEAVDGVGKDNANRCHKKAKNFGDGCKLQAQCTSALEHSVCVAGKCEKHPAFDVWTARVNGYRPRGEE